LTRRSRALPRTLDGKLPVAALSLLPGSLLPSMVSTNPTPTRAGGSVVLYSLLVDDLAVLLQPIGDQDENQRCVTKGR
jgi:hypothetical protein